MLLTFLITDHQTSRIISQLYDAAASSKTLTVAMNRQ